MQLNPVEEYLSVIKSEVKQELRNMSKPGGELYKAKTGAQRAAILKETVEYVCETLQHCRCGAEDDFERHMENVLPECHRGDPQLPNLSSEDWPEDPEKAFLPWDTEMDPPPLYRQH